MTVLLSVIGALCATLLALIAWILKDQKAQVEKDIASLKESNRKDMDDLKELTRVNGKHLDGVMTSLWGLTWKMNSVEDFLEEAYRGTPSPFHPPRTIGKLESDSG